MVLFRYPVWATLITDKFQLSHGSLTSAGNPTTFSHNSLQWHRSCKRKPYTYSRGYDIQDFLWKMLSNWTRYWILLLGRFRMREAKNVAIYPFFMVPQYITCLDQPNHNCKAVDTVLWTQYILKSIVTRVQTGQILPARGLFYLRDCMYSPAWTSNCI